MTTTADVDCRARALAGLDRLLDTAAALGLAVATDPRQLPPQALAAVLESAEGCCRLLEACQAALPVEGGPESRRGGRGRALSGPVRREGQAMRDEPLRRLADDAECRGDWFLGAAVADYQLRQGIGDAELATELRVSPADLDLLRLCRRPARCPG
jgi:hypothetical protein